MSSNNLTPELARELLWNAGNLSWILYPHQKSFYDAVKNCKDSTVVFNASRRIGKSCVMCILALETCLQAKNSLVKYCCAKQKDAREIIRPLITMLIETCPKEIKPEFKTMEGAWVFPNGSRIQLNGLDGGRAESIRGGSSSLAIIDEAGLVKDLEYIINSIILPTTLTTNGKIILASTPPKSIAHPFVSKYVNKARIEGNLITRTIYDNPIISKDKLDKIIEESGGIDSPDFRREYLCILESNSNYSIIPEFPLVKKDIVKEVPRAPFYDSYVSMDLGMNDLTVVLFAWYDFLNRKLIIDDEFVINGQKFNTLTLAEGIKRKEKEVFFDKLTGEVKPPYLRVSDNNLIVIKDLWDLHKLSFLPTKKDDAPGTLNNLRVAIQNKDIIINPKCVVLISHMETGVWNKSKTSFERTANSHFDAIDSLKYLLRNVNFNKNPYPSSYFQTSKENLYQIRTPQQSNKQNLDWKKIFGMKIK